jgi:hypothetical protein
MPAPDILALPLVAILGSAAQSATGFGVALPAAPVAFALLAPADAVLTVAAASLMHNLLVLGTRNRRLAIRTGDAALLIGAALPGLILGALIVSRVSKPPMQLAVGIAILAAVLFRVHEPGRLAALSTAPPRSGTRVPVCPAQPVQRQLRRRIARSRGQPARRRPATVDARAHAGATDGGEQVRVRLLERVAGALRGPLDAAIRDPRRAARPPSAPTGSSTGWLCRPRGRCTCVGGGIVNTIPTWRGSGANGSAERLPPARAVRPEEACRRSWRESSYRAAEMPRPEHPGLVPTSAVHF